MTKLKLLGQWLRTLLVLPEPIMDFDAHLRATGSAGITGTRPIEVEFPVDPDTHDQINRVIQAAYMDGIYLQSNFARTNAHVVACAASMGLITTQTSLGQYSNRWRPTHEGYLWLNSWNVHDAA